MKKNLDFANNPRGEMERGEGIGVWSVPQDHELELTYYNRAPTKFVRNTCLPDVNIVFKTATPNSRLIKDCTEVDLKHS